jgi:hypothetical protein
VRQRVTGDPPLQLGTLLNLQHDHERTLGRTQHNIKRWSSGEMALRWTAAGMLEAERQFRRIIGYRGLATLVVAVERELAGHHPFDGQHTPTKETAIVATV